MSRRLKPNVAIVTDVTHDTQSPMYDKKLQGDTKCGGGPAVTTGPAVQNNLLKLIVDTAKKNKIAIQRQAAGRSTGTDTDAFAYSDIGVASALISLPLKYMHTTVETVAYTDIEDCIQLMYESLLTIKSGQDFRYFK
jgi:putative aminopeptidase FrvX